MGKQENKKDERKKIEKDEIKREVYSQANIMVDICMLGNRR
jgi:hypothetical protein